jgi:EmrB/QacA subfamily drug resistance transporter
MMRTATGPRVIALIVACALFMAQLDSSVVLVALPAMARSFAVRPIDLSIGITIYILAQAVLLPSSSWVADRFGARRTFVFALIGFTLASMLCGLSRTLPEFVAARTLQGVAAALMTPVARILLLESTEKEDLIGVMTISTVPMLVAPTLGPPVGGFITTYLSWPWIFLLNVPIGVVGVVLVMRFIPPTVALIRRPFDVAGFVLLAGATTGVLFGLDELSTSSVQWGLGGVLTLLGGCCGWLAFRHLRRHSHPLISLDAVQLKTFRATTLSGGTLARLPMRALPFVLPLLFQVALGYSAVAVGFLLLAMNGGDLMLKTLVTRSLRRFGFRRVLLWSTTLMSATVVAAALLCIFGSYLTMLVVLAASGMARSLLFSALSTLAFADVPRAELGSASVLWNLAVQMTSAFGVSLGAICMNLIALVAHEPIGHVSLRNGVGTLLVMALIGATSLFSFARLPPDAGAKLSGHREAYMASE